MKISQQSICPDVKDCPPAPSSKEGNHGSSADKQLKLFLCFFYKKWPHATRKINILGKSQHFLDSQEAFMAGYIAGKADCLPPGEEED